MKRVKKFPAQFILLAVRSRIGGEGEIRTRGRLLAYEHLANAWFQPLTHFSAGHIIGFKQNAIELSCNASRRTKSI